MSKVRVVINVKLPNGDFYESEPKEGTEAEVAQFHNILSDTGLASLNFPMSDGRHVYFPKHTIQNSVITLYKAPVPE